jgi:hypothetical protein
MTRSLAQESPGGVPLRLKLAFFLCLESLLLGSACAIRTARPGLATEPAPEASAPTLVSDEYRIQADRKQLAELRAEVPEEKKKSNDELAVILQLMENGKKHPSEIRERYNTLVRKKREKFNKDMMRSREKFSSEERKNRESFTKTLQSERERFAKKKSSSSARKDFYDQHDARRKEYFAAEREKRAEYESEVSEKRKSFEDYLREKNNEFSNEHRVYSQAWQQRKKDEDEAKKSNDKKIPIVSGEEDFEIPEGASTPLNSGP